MFVFFTAVLTLVLAMSIPPRKHAAAYDSTIREQLERAEPSYFGTQRP
jgi:hypothetical protein